MRCREGDEGDLPPVKRVMARDVSLHHHLLPYWLVHSQGLLSVSERVMIVPLPVEIRASSITGQPRLM